MPNCDVPTRDIEIAAGRISRYVRRTPVLRLKAGELGPAVPIALKLEFLQHTGSFKPRGAFNRLLLAEPPEAGVVTASGGNHGAAVAYAAQVLGLRAEVFVPEPTSAKKCVRIEGFGARLVRTGASYAEALAASRARQGETGALEVHAYDHADVLAGQGTVGMEFEADASDLTHVLVATGGGGLIGGIAAWYGGRVRVLSVEPRLPYAARGLCRRASGAGVAVRPRRRQPGRARGGVGDVPDRTAYVADAVLVSDAAIRTAQRLLWQRLRIVAEPGGATALAALLSGRVPAARGCARGRRAVRRQLFTGQHRVNRRRISQGSRFQAETGVFARGRARALHARQRRRRIRQRNDDDRAGGVVPQCRQALANIAQALAEAGAAFEHVVRVRYYLLDAADFPPCFPLLREAFGSAPPAATMLVVAGLAAPEMRIEIEATALLPE